jgi:hypothetical protein
MKTSKKPAPSRGGPRIRVRMVEVSAARVQLRWDGRRQ